MKEAPRCPACGSTLAGKRRRRFTGVSEVRCASCGAVLTLPMTRPSRIVTALLLLAGAFGTARLFLVQDPFIDTPQAWLWSFAIAVAIGGSAGYSLLVDRRARNVLSPRKPSRSLARRIQELHPGQVIILLVVLAGLFYGALLIRQAGAIIWLGPDDPLDPLARYLHGYKENRALFWIGTAGCLLTTLAALSALWVWFEGRRQPGSA